LHGQASDTAHATAALIFDTAALGYANQRDWWMFKVDALVPGCLPGRNVDEAADANPEANQAHPTTHARTIPF